MNARFIHTADWQIGKPFAQVEDTDKRARLRHERFAVIERIAVLAEIHEAEFVLVAGDLFDSSTADRATVSSACAAIGKIKVPVLVIPGNHDHGGPGTIWEQPFFLREQSSLAPNLRVLLSTAPVELPSALIFPCPLLRRRDSQDTTAHLRAPEAFAECGRKARVILAHGSTRVFSSAEQEEGSATNLLDLEQLRADQIDYIALGDWHGTVQVNDRAWYSGTPEPDRFPRGDTHYQGQVLLVNAARGFLPKVEPLAAGKVQWHQLSRAFSDDAELTSFSTELDQRFAGRAGEDVLNLRLSGSLGINASSELEKLLETLRARLLRLDLANQLTVTPAAAELDALANRASDPLISQVARKLIETCGTPGPDADIARIALRELHTASATH